LNNGYFALPPSTDIPRNTHPEDLKAAIRKTGRTMEGFSVELGYTPAAVGIALRRRWHDVRVGIASLLDRPIQDIWPEDYHSDGTPRLHRPRKTSRRLSRSRRQKSTEGLAI
jgi:Ner family transcriptional regulator